MCAEVWGGDSSHRRMQHIAFFIKPTFRSLYPDYSTAALCLHPDNIAASLDYLRFDPAGCALSSIPNAANLYFDLTAIGIEAQSHSGTLLLIKTKRKIVK